MSDAEKLNAIADELDKAMKDFVAKAVPLFQEANETLARLNKACDEVFSKLGERSEE